MRAIGLDVGTKRIGVAVSDELGVTAQGLTTIHRSSLREDLRELKRLSAEHSVSRIVVGLPLNMDGSEGPSAEGARKLGALVQTACSVPVEYWDERLSTVSAERALIEGNVSREKRRQVIDRVAASIILQSWLDAQRPRDPDEYDSEA